MLTQQQIECIDNLCIGTKTIQEIADEIGCTTRVIYKWKSKDEEFKAELQKRSHAFETGLIDEAQSLLKQKLGTAVKNILDIANDKAEKSETRLKANQYLVDRVLGNTTTKIEQTGEDKQNNKTMDIDSLVEEIKTDNNVIDLPLEKKAK